MAWNFVVHRDWRGTFCHYFRNGKHVHTEYLSTDWRLWLTEDQGYLWKFYVGTLTINTNKALKMLCFQLPSLIFVVGRLKNIGASFLFAFLVSAGK